jgi:hypothetical protein
MLLRMPPEILVELLSHMSRLQMVRLLLSSQKLNARIRSVACGLAKEHPVRQRFESALNIGCMFAVVDVTRAVNDSNKLRGAMLRSIGAPIPADVSPNFQEYVWPKMLQQGLSAIKEVRDEAVAQACTLFQTQKCQEVPGSLAFLLLLAPGIMESVPESIRPEVQSTVSFYRRSAPETFPSISAMVHGALAQPPQGAMALWRKLLVRLAGPHLDFVIRQLSESYWHPNQFQAFVMAFPRSVFEP